MSVKSVACRKLEYSRKLSPQNVQKNDIQEHFFSEGISFPVPDCKYAGKRFMRTSMKKPLDMYNLSEKTSRNISLDTMYHYHPKHVKLQGKIPLQQSCCKKCLNFENVSKIIAQYLQGMFKDLNVAVDSTLCKYEGIFPKIDCVLHMCCDCGTGKLCANIENANASKLQDTRKRFLVKQWENKSREYNGVSQSYLNWKVDRYSYKDLIDLYIAHLNVMSEHTFMAL